ncbi:MAG TPA: hypothetical protein VK541_14675 [Pedobacter sp.]|uniref:hypothetical protein n=1 Tax=Pedobacter sp. TaxID=1411316 RepID=UPI002C82DB59|nr:hypothetical protein [Pedobacter sp.]HMI03725.1 hypothetical protein [Pedobacter sp.]
MAKNYIAGDLTEIVCSHPTLGDFRFEPKANERFTIDRGGIRSNDDANSITGGGNNIDVMTRVRWSVEGPMAEDLVTDSDAEALNDLAGSPEPGVWTFTHISGAIYKGTGKPVGDMNSDTNTAQRTLKVAGGGRLEKI